MPEIRQRTCIGCRKVAEKGTMTRITKLESGFELDPAQRKPGRGAYVCSAACLERAIGAKALERAFKCKVSANDKEVLAAQFAALPQ